MNNNKKAKKVCRFPTKESVIKDFFFSVYEKPLKFKCNIHNKETTFESKIITDDIDNYGNIFDTKICKELDDMSLHDNNSLGDIKNEDNKICLVPDTKYMNLNSDSKLIENTNHYLSIGKKRANIPCINIKNDLISNNYVKNDSFNSQNSEEIESKMCEYKKPNNFIIDEQVPIYEKFDSEKELDKKEICNDEDLDLNDKFENEDEKRINNSEKRLIFTIKKHLYESEYFNGTMDEKYIIKLISSLYRNSDKKNGREQNESNIIDECINLFLEQIKLNMCSNLERNIISFKVNKEIVMKLHRKLIGKHIWEKNIEGMDVKFYSYLKKMFQDIFDTLKIKSFFTNSLEFIINQEKKLVEKFLSDMKSEVSEEYYCQEYYRLEYFDIISNYYKNSKNHCLFYTNFVNSLKELEKEEEIVKNKNLKMIFDHYINLYDNQNYDQDKKNKNQFNAKIAESINIDQIEYNSRNINKLSSIIQLLSKDNHGGYIRIDEKIKIDTEKFLKKFEKKNTKNNIKDCNTFTNNQYGSFNMFDNVCNDELTSNLSDFQLMVQDSENQENSF